MSNGWRQEFQPIDNHSGSTSTLEVARRPLILLSGVKKKKRNMKSNLLLYLTLPPVYSFMLTTLLPYYLFPFLPLNLIPVPGGIYSPPNPHSQPIYMSTGLYSAYRLSSPILLYIEAHVQKWKFLQAPTS